MPIANLASVRDKQPVLLKTVDGRAYQGFVRVINAMITPETRTGHVIATFNNPDFSLHPGVLLNAEIALAQTPAKMLIPRAAVQLMHNEPTVFLRVADGFEKRRVDLGDSDAEHVEVTGGIAPGDVIAVTNTFVLKAEAGKNDIPEE